MHFKFRSYYDHGTGRVIHPFTQQILTETALFPFQTVGQGFQCTVRLGFYRIGFSGIIEQRIHSFLQHTLLVPQDHFRSLYLDQPFQSVVTDDNPSVKIVQIGGGETASV